MLYFLPSNDHHEHRVLCARHHSKPPVSEAIWRTQLPQSRNSNKQKWQACGHQHVLTGLVMEGSSSVLMAEGASSRGCCSSSPSSSRSALLAGSSKGEGMRLPHLRPLMGLTGVGGSLEEMYVVADISSSSSSSEICITDDPQLV